MRDIIDKTNLLFETDEYQWLLNQIENLQTEKYESLDHGNLLQILLEMARREQRELESRFVVLLQHMLKFRVQPQRASRSWIHTVVEQQGEIESIFEKAPSLKNYYAPQLFAKAYLRAVKQAAIETNIPRGEFPAENPWSIEDAINFIPPEK